MSSTSAFPVCVSTSMVRPPSRFDGAVLHRNLVLQPPLIPQQDQFLQGILQRDQRALGLCCWIVSVSDVHCACLLFLCTNHCQIVRAQLPISPNMICHDLPKMKLYCCSWPVRIFFCIVFPLISISQYILALWKMRWISSQYSLAPFMTGMTRT